MDFNIEDVFNVLEDAENNKTVRNHFRERNKLDLNIKALTIEFRVAGNRLMASLDVDFADSENQMKNEDLNILMELKDEHWKVNNIIDTKLS